MRDSSKKEFSMGMAERQNMMEKFMKESFKMVNLKGLEGQSTCLMKSSRGNSRMANLKEKRLFLLTDFVTKYINQN